MASWRDIALSLDVVSSVAIPLCPSHSIPVAVLTLYSSYAGGLQSDDQQAFLDRSRRFWIWPWRAFRRRNRERSCCRSWCVSDGVRKSPPTHCKCTTSPW